MPLDIVGRVGDIVEDIFPRAVDRHGYAKGPQVTAEYFLPDGSSAGVITSNKGIAQGYFKHSPTCILHPAESH